MRVQILAVLSEQVSVKNPNGSIGANVEALPCRCGNRNTSAQIIDKAKLINYR